MRNGSGEASASRPVVSLTSATRRYNGSGQFTKPKGSLFAWRTRLLFSLEGKLEATKSLPRFTSRVEAELVSAVLFPVGGLPVGTIFSVPSRFGWDVGDERRSDSEEGNRGRRK